MTLYLLINLEKRVDPLS